jgi:hypothetical protein
MLEINCVKLPRLVPTSLVNRGSMELAPYTITGFTLCSSMANEGSVFIRIQFERKLLGFLLTTCLPTIMFIIIAHITNYFGRQSFDSSIGVNLTLLLVITTM